MTRFLKKQNLINGKDVIEVMDGEELLACIYASDGEFHVKLISKHVMMFELEDEPGPAALNIKFQRRS